MYAWGLCPFLGMEIYSEKSLDPRNLSGINLGTVQPPVGTTHGDSVASPTTVPLRPPEQRRSTEVDVDQREDVRAQRRPWR